MDQLLTSHTHLELREGAQTTSTHVLVPEEQIERLRELSKRTRVAQSEYLREAVDDLLRKYGITG
jgi:predicted DNA-binding protein